MQLQSRSKKETCPYGTIPIQRTTEDEAERAINLSNEMFHHIDHTNHDNTCNPFTHVSYN